MKAKPGVVEALDALLVHELTLHEGAKAWRAVFEAHGYREFAKFMDKQNTHSGCRRRWLEKRIIAFEGTVELSMNAVSVDPNAVIESVLKDAYTFMNSLLAQYGAAWTTVMAANDHVTAHSLMGFELDIEKSILRLERYFRQIADMDIKLFVLSSK